MWQSRLGEDPDVIGTTLRLGSEPHTVVGVMPDEFAFPDVDAEAWVPLRLDVPGGFAFGGRLVFGRVFGKLAPGVTVEEAQAELSTLSRRAAPAPDMDANLRPRVAPSFESFWDGDWVVVLSLNVFVGMLLLLVSSSVALLVFARAATRETEIAVRTALGAGRGRIMMQLAAESLVLAAIASLIGLAAAHVILRWQFGFEEYGYLDGTGLASRTVLYAGLLTSAAAAIWESFLGSRSPAVWRRGFGRRPPVAAAFGSGAFGRGWSWRRWRSPSRFPTPSCS